MSNTKRNIKEIPHYELTTRINAKDMLNFSYHLTVENELYKFNHSKYHIIRFIIVLVLYPLILQVIIGADMVFDSEPLRLFLSLISGFSLVKILFSIRDRNPKLTVKKTVIAVVDSTYTRLGRGEREVYFNLGKDGFSTNTIKKKGIMFYDYKIFRRIIECEHGIVLILDEEQIICIPSRCFDDDSACFLIKKLRRKCRGRFISTGKMKIEKTDGEAD